MKKTLTAIVAAGALAAAGLAQADAIFYPDGTSVELGDSSVETLALDSSTSMDTPMVDTTVLGGPAATTATTATTVTVPRLVYVQPNIDFDRATAVSQMHSRKAMLRDHRMASSDTKDTFNVPQRAGEASTMTGGAPNAVTDNHVIVGGNTISHAMVSVDQPYYVMSN